MRVALLSMLDHAGERGEGQKAFISFAGKTVARRQVDRALALGCERVVCLAENLGPVLIALQHQVEAAGAKFHVITMPRALCGLVHANDDVIVLADGVLPLAEEAQAVLSTGNGVLVFPAETGIPAGFERIDLNHAWAGAMAIPGRLVERLNELPRDCDGIAALLRIALQGRVPERALPDAVLSEGRWAMLESGEQAESLEPGWFRRHAEAADAFSPGRWLGGWLAGRFGVAWLRHGVRPGYLLGAAALLVFGALALGWSAMVSSGLAVLALSWTFGEAAAALDRAERAGSAGKALFSRLCGVLLALSDMVLLVLLMLGLDVRFDGWPERLFAPLILLGLIWLVPAIARQRWGALCGDRALLALLLAIGGFVGVLLPVTQGLALAMIGCALVFARLSRG